MYQTDGGSVLVHPEEPAKGTATAMSLSLSRDPGPQGTGLGSRSQAEGSWAVVAGRTGSF